MRAASKRHTKTTRSTRVCLPAPAKMISSRAIPRARVAMLITEGSPDRPRSPAAENPRGAAPADSSSRVVSGEQMLRTCPSRPCTGQVVAETGTHRRMSECTGPARVTFIARFPRSGEIAPVSGFKSPLGHVFEFIVQRSLFAVACTLRGHALSLRDIHIVTGIVCL
jgi:hypothetical protein